MLDTLSRQEARYQKLVFYYTGIPCRSGHTSNRYASSGSCAECVTQRSMKVRLSQPEIPRAYAQQRRDKKRTLCKEVANRYYRNNKAKCLATRKQYREQNPDMVQHLNAIRRALKRRAVPPWFERDKVFNLYRKAGELNRLWGSNFTVDHVVPLYAVNERGEHVVCGLHCWDNLQLLNANDNYSKQNTFLGE